MFDFLKSQNNQSPLDIKSIRSRLLQFIKEQLQRWEGGEGGKLKGMQLYLSPSAEEKELYEAAIYIEEENRFKDEIQKIADDFAIDLPANWTVDILFTDGIPMEAIHYKNLPFGLHLVTTKQPLLNKPSTAQITVLAGEAEQKTYNISSGNGKIFIGRDRHIQTNEGFFRINTIAFPGDSLNEGNRYISRQHAHIEWVKDAGCFFLFADEGGIPPRNKVKVQTGNGSLIKLQTIQIGHPLQEGDQIVLGESALLLFEYLK